MSSHPEEGGVEVGADLSRGADERTILFGGSGFLGPYLLRNHPEMISAGRTPPATGNRHIQIRDLAELDVLDDVDFDRVIYIIGNTDHHQLERKTLPRGVPNAFDYHTIPLLRTLEQLKERPIRKFIHFSTVLMYDEHRLTLPVSEDAPIDPYKNRYVLSKYLGEEACKYYAQWVPIINVRMSNLYGPTPLDRFDLIHRVSRQLLDEGRAEVWSTRPSRDFIHVDDAAVAIAALLDSDYVGTVNLGTGTMSRVREVVDLLAAVSGCVITDRDERVSGPMEFRCDTSTLRRIIDWDPKVSLEHGVRQTYETMKAWRG